MALQLGEFCFEDLANELLGPTLAGRTTKHVHTMHIMHQMHATAPHTPHSSELMMLVYQI